MPDTHNPNAESAPSQSSKTVTYSFTDEGNTSGNKIRTKTGKSRLKRGETQRYLLQHSSEEIVFNTLWGLLIKFIRSNGPQSFSTLEKLVTCEYKNIRKLSGHHYTGNIKKSLKGALTSNGLFSSIEDSNTNGMKDSNHSDSSSSKRTKTDGNTIWKVVEDVAGEFIRDKIAQVNKQKLKLKSKKSKANMLPSKNT